MFSIIDREAMEREEAELKAAQAVKEAEKKAATPLVPSSRVMPPTPPSSRWDGTDTLRTPTTDTVASQPAPKESKSLQSWFFTEEAEADTDRFAEPQPPPPKSESFFSGWTIFETLFGSRTNTEGDTTTTTGFFSAPIPRRTGWLFIDIFLSEKTGTTARKPGFSFLTKFLLLAVPLIAFAGYYQYASVSGATILGKTLSNSVNLERGLVGHWTFDGGDMTAVSGSNATSTDVSGNNNHIRHTNATLDKRVAGKVGQALQINSGNNSRAPTSASISNLSTITVAMWIRPVLKHDSSGFQNPLINKGSWGFSKGWELTASSTEGSIQFRYDRSATDGIWKTSRNQYSINEWFFVAVTYDASSTSNDPKIYINGTSVVLTESSAPAGTASGDALEELRLNHDMLGGTYNGATLDDVRIYNRVLSAKEIERLYKIGEGVKINTNTIPAGSTLEDGLVGYWSFNGADFTDKVYDRSGQNNHGYLVNMATTSAKVPGKVGQGLIFDGANDYVNAGSDASLDNVVQKTISMWVKPRTIANSMYLLSKSNQFELLIEPTSRKLRLNQGFIQQGRWETTTSSISTGEWSFIAVTYDRSATTNDPIFYINGHAVSTIETQTPVNPVGDDSPHNLALGNYSTLPIAGFDGTLDEVRIYNRVLSADEVRQLYESGGGSTMGMCGQGPVLDADGNKYGIVQIGTQCWLDRNMNVGTRISGATTQTDNATIEKWCYNNTDSNCNDNHPKRPDGGLYQWNEAMQYSTSEGAQGICPAGWHIPTHDELTTLERAVCTSGSCATDFPYDTTTAGWSGTNEGSKLIANGPAGFELNSAGYGLSGSFTNRNGMGFLWSSTQSGATAWLRVLIPGFPQVLRSFESKSRGVSVRCLKD